MRPSLYRQLRLGCLGHHLGEEALDHGSKGEEYTDQGQACYEERYRQRVIANLNRRARQLRLQVVPVATPVPA